MNKINKKKVLVCFLLIFLFLIIGTVGYGYYLMNRIKVKDKSAHVVELTKPVNILLMGLDAGIIGSKKDPGSKRRSDTMMLLRYTPKTNNVKILSIPRDTKVEFNNKTRKLNSAHYFGGPDLTIKTIENLLGIDINYYAEVDYSGFRECIDAIGGINITIPQDMNYDAYDIHIHFKKGETVHMDGEKAEEFVRWRKNNHSVGYKMGDLGRISTQQDFMVKVAEKIKSPSGIIRLPILLNTLSKYVKTNMDSDIMLQYAFKMKSIKISSIEKKILEGSPKMIDGQSYFVYKDDKNNEFENSFKDNYTVAENNTNINKSEIKVAILNSTGVNGLAKEYKDKLSKLGYDIVEIGNYKTFKSKTVINDFSNDNYGQIIGNDMNFENIKNKSEETKTNSNADVVVILGKDSLK